MIESNVIRLSQTPELIEKLLNVSEETKLENVISNIYDYQIYMLEYGLCKLREDIAFYEKILNREVNSK